MERCCATSLISFDLQKTAFPLLSHPSSNLWLGMRAELNIIIAICGPFGKRD
jgi:hypothetical protein